MSCPHPSTLSDLSSHRTPNRPPRVVHPTRDVHRHGSLLALPGAVVMYNASTPLSMPLGVHPYSINSLGSLPWRCPVPSTVISQTFLSYLSTRILSHFQIPCPLLDLCVAEKHLCARIPSRVALSLPRASHSIGSIPRFSDPPILFQNVPGHHCLVSHSIQAESLSTISCLSSHAASIPARRAEPSLSLSLCILLAYNQSLTFI